MYKIKAVLFSLRNILFDEPTPGQGVISAVHIDSIGRLFSYLRANSIQPVIFANDKWTVGTEKKDLETLLSARLGSPRWFVTSRDGLPQKPLAASTAEVLKKIGILANEALYVGNSEIDMRTAVNAGVLFINGTWMKDACDYGFKINTVEGVGRFIDTFFVRSHGWHFSIRESSLEYFSLAPFSTMTSVDYRLYSEDAVSAAKNGLGHVEFWGQYLCATMYLQGIAGEIDYVAPFPCHSAQTWRNSISGSLLPFTKCFRTSYLKDLIIRHADAPKSSVNKHLMNHSVHLNSLRVNGAPTKPGGSTYAKSPLKAGKTVLIVDDIATKGHSLDAARILVQQTGARVILVSWLKTINTSFEMAVSDGRGRFNPYVAHADWKKEQITVNTIPYRNAITDGQAHLELGQKLLHYDQWKLP